MIDPVATPFERLRELSLRIPEGAQELLPVVDFLETFPQQTTEEALVHLVGVTALGICKAGQGGLWSGSRWLFLRGAANPFPARPGDGWISMPWTHGEEVFGHLVVRTTDPPPALDILLSISAPLLAWRRLEQVRSEQNRALALQLSRLNTLFELTRSLGEVERSDDLVRLMANTVAGEFMIQRLLVVGPTGHVRYARGLGQLPEVLEGETLHALVAEKGLVHIMELRDQDHSHGFAYAADPANGGLTDEDELFFQTLLNLAGTQLTTLELREARLQGIRMEKDLDLARNIQRRILPKQLPEPEGWRCAAANLPYQAVGGDLYDLWMASDEGRAPRLHLAVGDISGKGLPASLMMTQLSAFIRAMADRRVPDWGELCHRLNHRMNEVREGNRYTTLLIGSLNPENGDFRYVNAGHNPPLLVPGDGGPARRLEGTGPMVGLLPEVTFREGHAALLPGDTLLVFTDGLVEAENPVGEDLGDEALADLVRLHPEADAETLLELLLALAFEHLDGQGFRDDVTLVVVKRFA